MHPTLLAVDMFGRAVALSLSAGQHELYPLLFIPSQWRPPKPCASECMQTGPSWGMGRDEMLPVFQALNQPPSTPPPTAQQQTQQQAREPQPAGARA
eukprot:1159107-Pelagomonas_calceolata.AAC.2